MQTALRRLTAAPPPRARSIMHVPILVGGAKLAKIPAIASKLAKAARATAAVAAGKRLREAAIGTAKHGAKWAPCMPPGLEFLGLSHSYCC